MNAAFCHDQRTHPALAFEFVSKTGTIVFDEVVDRSRSTSRLVDLLRNEVEAELN